MKDYSLVYDDDSLVEFKLLRLSKILPMVKLFLMDPRL